MSDTEITASLFDRLFLWLRSTAGIAIVLTLVVAILAALDRGAYIIVNTVVTGGMWALMAVGLTLIFGVMNIPNFAHGEYFMLGTLGAYYIFRPLDNYLRQNPHVFLALVAPIIAIFGAAILGAVSGLVTEKLVFYRLRKRTKEQWVMNCFLITIGLSVILINGHQLVFGTVYKGIVNYWHVPSVSLFGVFISVDRMFASVLAVVVIILFTVFMKFSRTGRAIRAVSQDESGALMVGISVNTIHALTLTVGCGLAALAGASLLFMFPSYPTVGLGPLYNSWFVILVVGFGNVAGAMAGGFIIALLQVLTRVYAGEGWEYVIPMALISAILVFKPTGIFGAKVRGIWEQ